MPEKEVFSEQQIGAIMRRAAELQEAETASTYVPGVTKTELQRIADEVGIKPEFLERALREATNPESEKGWLKLTEEFERVVDTELSPEDFDILLSELHSMRRRPVTQVGRTLQGRVWNRGSVAYVNVTSRNGRTKIKVKSNAITAFLFSIYPLFFIYGMLAGVVVNANNPFLVALLSVLPGLLGLFGFVALTKKGRNDARALADRLQKRVEQEAPSVRDNLARSTATGQDSTEAQSQQASSQ